MRRTTSLASRRLRGSIWSAVGLTARRGTMPGVGESAAPENSAEYGAPSVAPAVSPRRVTLSDLPPSRPRGVQDLTPICVEGTADFTSQASRYGSYSACVRAGTVIALSLAPVGPGRWLPLQADPATDVQIEQGPPTARGVLSARLTATHAGSVRIDTSTHFAADPHGPPSWRWELHLTVLD